MAACDDAATAKAALVEAISGPSSVTTDAGTVAQHSLTEMLDAARALGADCAAKKPGRGLRFTRLVPPGAVQ